MNRTGPGYGRRPPRGGAPPAVRVVAAAGARSVGLGSDLVPKALVAANDFDGLVRHAEGVVTAVLGSRVQ